MMFLIDVKKLFPLGIICNIIIIFFAVSTIATVSEHGSINTPKILYKNINEHTNQPRKILEESQNGNNNGGITTAPVTDSEIPDLIKPHLHTKSASSDVVTKVPEEQAMNNRYDDFGIDSLSEAERTRKANGRFNPTSGAIAAATCLSLAFVGYLGIVLWRNVIHRNYENREILLNEDDIGDINDEDMRHFELKLMDKDGRVIEPSRG